MSLVIDLAKIKSVAENMDFSEVIEKGFIAYSKGEVVVPPVGELYFDNPPGDTHIKYGYIKNDDVYVIKIASGFYDNPKINLSSSTGLMLVFCQKTGMLKAILLDEGHLTNIRTAVAGQIAAKYLAPSQVDSIGVFGLGIQGKMQVDYLKSVTDCRKVVAWGRSEEKLAEYVNEMKASGFDVKTTVNPEEVATQCNLIVMTTPSQTPLLNAEHVRPGTHITAMGSDTLEKQELDSRILAMADVVVADSIPQCLERGEIFKAIENKQLTQSDIVELGNVIRGEAKGRTSDSQITVTDLTGVAVQDIQIAKAIYNSVVN